MSGSTHRKYRDGQRQRDQAAIVPACGARASPTFLQGAGLMTGACSEAPGHSDPTESVVLSVMHKKTRPHQSCCTARIQGVAESGRKCTTCARIDTGPLAGKRNGCARQASRTHEPHQHPRGTDGGGDRDEDQERSA